MADIWLPGYARVPLGSAVRGRPYQFTHNPKGCLHTTEGSSIAGARAAYAPYPPHLIYDWRTRTGEQHVALNYAAYSAMDGNDDDYMIQVELVGFANQTRGWPEQALRNIAADVIAPLEKAFGIPRRAIPVGFKDELDRVSPALASTSSPIRLTWQGLRDFSGWLGHQHLPAPDSHWDPGAIPINRILSYMEEDEMLTPDDGNVRWAWINDDGSREELEVATLLGKAAQRTWVIKEAQAQQTEMLAQILAAVSNGELDPETVMAELGTAAREGAAAGAAVAVETKILPILRAVVLDVVREALGADNEEQAEQTATRVVDLVSERLRRSTGEAA